MSETVIEQTTAADQRRLTLRPGLLPALLATALAGLATLWLIATAQNWEWIAARGAVAGLGLLIISVLVGAQWGIAVSALPLLTAALFSGQVEPGPDWERSLIIACLWYVATELAWGSVELRQGADRNPAVGRRRSREVAVVVLGAVALGLAAAALAESAPARSLPIQILVGLVLLGLPAAVLLVLRPAPGRGSTPKDQPEA